MHVRDKIHNLQAEFLSLSGANDAQLEATLNKLEWTEAQINGLREYIYTSGLQSQACVNDNGELVSKNG